jgi:hypothetical protein
MMSASVLSLVLNSLGLLGFCLIERLIWRGAFTLSDRTYHVITRDELYDLCLQDWVGFGHLGSEYPQIYRLSVRLLFNVKECHSLRQ